jgi:hypothetical protein
MKALNLAKPESYDALINKVQRHLANNHTARLLLFEYVNDEFLRSHTSMTISRSIQVWELVDCCMACSRTVWNNQCNFKLRKTW